MFYIYRSFSIAGWIAAAAFFVFLFGFQWGVRRAARRRQPELRGFDVTPTNQPAAEPQPPPTAEQTTDAKHL